MLYLAYPMMSYRNTFGFFLSTAVLMLISTSASYAQSSYEPALFTYVQIDSTRTINDSNGEGQEPKRKWFGFAVGDIDGDGHPDIGAGKWVYLNPGPDLHTVPWERLTLRDSMDIILIRPAKAGPSSFVALRCNEQHLVHWNGEQFQYRQVGSEPICDHTIGSMGYAWGDLLGNAPLEIIINSQKGEALYAFEASPMTDTFWKAAAIGQGLGVEKGLAIADVDHDGLNDVLVGMRPTDSNFGIGWLKNSGYFGPWQVHPIDTMPQKPDRILTADVNGDGQRDIIVTQGQWPGDLPEASLLWYQRSDTTWIRHLIGRQYSTNSLSAGDIDGDGDIDLVTGEHKGPHPKTQWWENDGHGNFTEHLIDQGKEHHMGTLLVDFDLDGDLDIASAGYDKHEYVHLWINEGTIKR